MSFLSRLSFYESDMRINFNQDGTTTISIQDDRLGETPLVRTVRNTQCIAQVSMPAEKSAVKQESGTAVDDEEEDAVDDGKEDTVDDGKNVQDRSEVAGARCEQPKVEAKKEVFCFRKPGDKCSRCNVIKCALCPFMHEDGRCFATGRECFYCGGIGHYQSKCAVRWADEAKKATGRR